MTTDQGNTDVVRAHSAEAAGAAKDRAGEVTSHAATAAGDVKDTAVEQARNVKDETVRQARDLLGEAKAQMSTQASDQTTRLVGNLRSVAAELRQMAQHGSGGFASEVAQQLADRAHATANSLDGREPADLLDEARRFARRRPAVFLASAAALGFLSGRLGRGMKDAKDANDTNDTGSSTSSATGRPGYSGEPYPSETLGPIATGVGPTAGSDLTAAPDVTATSPAYGAPSYSSGTYGQTTSTSGIGAPATYSPGTTGYERAGVGTGIEEPLAGTQMDPSEPVTYGLDDETTEFRAEDRRTEGF